MSKTVIITGILLFLFSPSLFSQRWLDAPRVFTEAPSLCVGDVDNDLDTDVLVFAGGNALTLLNDGAADFQHGPVTILPTGTTYTADQPRLADVNGDSLLDMIVQVVGGIGGDGLHIFRGLGNGAFAAPDFMALSSTPSRFAFGDFNNDGRTDIVTAVGANPLQVIWIYYDGVQFQTSAAANVPNILAASGITALDYNADGFDDAVVASFSHGTIELVPTLNGNPRFAASLPVATLGFDTAYLDSGDLDGDGDEDLLVAVTKTDPITLIPFEQTAGALVQGVAQTFNTVSTMGLTFGASGMSLGDWDGDGDLDVASQIELQVFTVGDLRATLIENVGGLQFATPVQIPVPTVGRPGGMADFDGDGYMDYCGNQVILFGDGTFTSPFPLDQAPVSTEAHVLDFDDDGDTDFVETTLAFINNGAGALTLTDDLRPDPGVGFYYNGTSAFGDFNGDGRSDYLAELWIPVGTHFEPDIFVEERLLLQLPDGSFFDSGAATGPKYDIGGAGLMSADFDGDGDVDILTLKGLLHNDGTGHFWSLTQVISGNLEDNVDVDGDGDLDVLTRSGDSLSVQVKGTGLSYSPTQILNIPGLRPGAQFLDIDGDGDMDVAASSVVTGPFGGTKVGLHLVENVGGSFLAPVSLEPGGISVEVFGAGDVDGDGLTDFLAASVKEDGAHWSLEYYGPILVYRSTGPGFSFEPRRRYLGHWTGKIVDIDSDGDVDVIGRTTVRGTRYQGPDAGLIRQYGKGTPGLQGAVPLLGARGPARVGSTAFELRLRGGLGAAPVLLVVGNQEAASTDLPLVGMTFYVGGAFSALPATLGGLLGGPGAGELTIPLTVPASLQGVNLFLQTWNFDKSAQNGLAQSNGLELLFGS